MNYTIEDDFDTTLDHYWQVFFDDAYNDALYQHLRIERKVEEFVREGEGENLIIRRRAVLTPQRELPALMKKFIQGAISYTEHNVFTARTNTIEVVTIPSFAADKFKSNGSYRVVPIGENKVRRTFTGECTCSVPLVGRKIETMIIDEVRESYQATTEFTRRWLKEHNS